MSKKASRFLKWSTDLGKDPNRRPGDRIRFKRPVVRETVIPRSKGSLGELGDIMPSTIKSNTKFDSKKDIGPKPNMDRVCKFIDARDKLVQTERNSIRPLPRKPTLRRKPVHSLRRKRAQLDYPKVVGEPSIYNDSSYVARRSYAQRYANKNKKRPTKAEVEMAKVLKTLKIDFIDQWAFEGKWILDFYLPKWKVGIEVDGPIHHRAAQKKKDKLKSAACSKHGIKLIRFKNSDLYSDLGYVNFRLSRYSNLPKASSTSSKYGPSTRKPPVKVSTNRKPAPSPNKSVVKFAEHQQAVSYMKNNGGSVVKSAESNGWLVKPPKT